MSKTLIIHANELVTCRGTGAKFGKEMSDIGLIHDGAVLIEDDTIIAVGTTEELQKQVAGDNVVTIDATGQAVLPGFVDSHTHFIFGGYRADEFSWRLKGDSYMSIMERGGGINASVTMTRDASLEELVEIGRRRLDEMVAFGVTTVEGKSGYGLDADTELKQLRAMAKLKQEHPIDIATTFLGPHSVLPEWKGKEMEFLEEMIALLHQIKEENLAEFADIFVEQNVFTIEQGRHFLTKAKELGFQLKIHADEIVCLGGAELAAEVGAVSADHLLQASDEGIANMIKAGTVCTLLPATAFCLKEHYARARHMVDSGAAVAVASDLNPGSCFTNAIPLLVALSCIYMGLTIEEVVTALTINGAAAIGRAETVGSIQVGKKADIVFLRYPSIQFMPYHTGVNLVSKVMKNGVIIHE